MTRIIATIEARMTSSRLPGKVLMPVLGKPILFYLVERLKAVPRIDNIVLATTTNAQDDALEKFAIKNDILFYRGSEDNVMQRVIRAAEHAAGEVIVEITGDCPIIDHEIVSQIINIYLNNDACYVSNAHVRGYPDGMDVQVFSLAALKKSYALTTKPLDYEHVTLHIRNNPDIFPTINIMPPDSLSHPSLGITLDEHADFELLSRIIELLHPENPLFSCRDVINLLHKQPELLSINSHITRKGNA